MRWLLLVVGILLVGVGGGRFDWDPQHTAFDPCVTAAENDAAFELGSCDSTTVAVRWSKGVRLALWFFATIHSDFEVTINGECTLHVSIVPNGHFFMVQIENVRTYSKGFLFVQEEGVNLELNGAIFCGGRSLRNDAGDGHFWTTVGFEKRGAVRNFQVKLPPVGAEGADLGEYRAPTTPTTSTSTPTTSTTTTGTSTAPTTTLAVTTPPPQVIVKGAFKCRTRPGKWGTVVVFNRRTDARGQSTVEFCGSQEMLSDGTLEMKAGGAENPGEVFYLIQHKCDPSGTMESFICLTGNVGPSEWAAKAVDLGRMELEAAGEACAGTSADTRISTKTVGKCTANDPLVDELSDLVGQTF